MASLKGTASTSVKVTHDIYLEMSTNKDRCFHVRKEARA